MKTENETKTDELEELKKLEANFIKSPIAIFQEVLENHKRTIEALREEVKQLWKQRGTIKVAELLLTESEIAELPLETQTAEITKRLELVRDTINQLKLEGGDYEEAVLQHISKKSKIGIKRLRNLLEIFKRFERVKK